MLTLLLAAGVIPEQSGVETGVFDVPDERVAVAAKLQAAAAMGTGIPFGAARWQQPFDPADHLPYGFSFDAVLEEGETISEVELIALSSAGAALGVIIDQEAGFAPVVDDDGGRRIQIWFAVDPAMQDTAPFDAAGAQVPVTFRILTSKQHRLERTAVLTVRQL